MKLKSSPTTTCNAQNAKNASFPARGSRLSPAVIAGIMLFGIGTAQAVPAPILPAPANAICGSSNLTPNPVALSTASTNGWTVIPTLLETGQSLTGLYVVNATNLTGANWVNPASWITTAMTTAPLDATHHNPAGTYVYTYTPGQSIAWSNVTGVSIAGALAAADYLQDIRVSDANGTSASIIDTTTAIWSGAINADPFHVFSNSAFNLTDLENQTLANGISSVSFTVVLNNTGTPAYAGDSTGGLALAADASGAGGLEITFTCGTNPPPIPSATATATSVPTLGEWALALLALSMAGFAALRVRRKQR